MELIQVYLILEERGGRKQPLNCKSWDWTRNQTLYYGARGHRAFRQKKNLRIVEKRELLLYCGDIFTLTSYSPHNYPNKNCHWQPKKKKRLPFTQEQNQRCVWPDLLPGAVTVPGITCFRYEGSDLGHRHSAKHYKIGSTFYHWFYVCGHAFNPRHAILNLKP